MGEVAVTGVVGSPPEEIFRFLADLENHWLLADRFIEVLALEGPPGARKGGRVRMRGPIGLRRTAATAVEAAHPSHLMIGTAEVGRRTRARVSWTLTSHDGSTTVRLAATLEDVGPLDRLLLLFGGRWWLSRRFSAILVRLADRFAAPSRQPVAGSPRSRHGPG